MAQNVTIAGASYSSVPAVDLPKSGGGTARFVDTSDANGTAADFNAGTSGYVNGVKVNGSQVIQRFYTGSTTPTSSFGNNGDLYLKVVQ